MLDQSAATRLFRNIVSITAFQASGYVLAMVNVPYLTRTLGVVDYGVLSFTISVNAYLWLIMDWGFSIGSTREIAQANGNSERIRQIFWQTMTAKGILSAVALAALIAIAAIYDVPSVPFILLLPGVINILSAILSVDWLVQGLQRMALFTLYSIASRALVVGLTIALVHSPEDVWKACCLQTLGSLAASIAGFMLVRRFFRMGRPIISIRSAIGQIWDYRHYFLTQSSWIAYSTAAPLLLTVVSGTVAVGLFVAAERITRIVMSVIFPLSSAAYPYINALVIESRESAAKLAGLLLVAQVLLGSTLAVVLLLGAKPIVTLVLGVEFEDSAIVLRCLALLPLLAGIASTFSKQFLIPLGWRREVSRLTVMSAGVYLFLLVLLGGYEGAVGAAIALMLSETLIAGGLITLLLRHERRFMLTACYAAILAPGFLVTHQRRFLQRYILCRCAKSGIANRP